MTITEFKNKLEQNNDMFNVSFEITTESDNQFKQKTTSLEEMPENLILNIWRKFYITKPENRYCVYGSKSLNFRKQKGTPKKLLEVLDRYFLTLNTALKEDLKNDNIHSNHIELLKSKLI